MSGRQDKHLNFKIEHYDLNEVTGSGEGTRKII
jgi:hypothetical protein